MQLLVYRCERNKKIPGMWPKHYNFVYRKELRERSFIDRQVILLRAYEHTRVSRYEINYARPATYGVRLFSNTVATELPHKKTRIKANNSNDCRTFLFTILWGLHSRFKRKQLFSSHAISNFNPVELLSSIQHDILLAFLGKNLYNPTATFCFYLETVSWRYHTSWLVALKFMKLNNWR